MNKTIKTIIALGVLISASSVAQAKDWKQYLEVNAGLNYGNIELKADGKKVRNAVDIHQLTNFNIGYGLDFNKFTFGIRGGLNRVNNSIKGTDLADYKASNSGLEVLNSNIEINPKEIYSLMGTGTYNILNFNKYKAGVIAGLGLAVHHINTSDLWNDNVFSVDQSLFTTVEEDSLKKKQTDYVPTFAFMLGVKQEFLINSNVAIGAEVSYVNLGSPEYKFKDLENLGGSPKLKLSSNGMLNINLGLKVYL